MEYTEKVIEHFMNPRNIGKLDDANATATEGSPACGDQVSFFLKINEETLIIDDIKFLSYGCASNIATASITSELVKGKHIEEAKKITWKEVMSELGGLPPTKAHCSVLAVDTLKNAIKNFEIAKGYIKEEPFNRATLMNELQKIIHPQAGENIITLKMVKYANFEDGKAIIELEIPKFDTYKDNIIEEIKEHMGKHQEVESLEFRV